MSDIQEHVIRLAHEIGPRPAGTEEEQQAALYIAEAMQKEAGLETEIEDFNCSPDFELPRAICCALTFVVALLAIVIPMMVIPALIISLVCAVLFVLEVMDKSVIARLFNKGVSQNVVAKYQPTEKPESGMPRRRKVIIVSHYDSGKTQGVLTGPLFSLLPIIRWVELAAMAIIPILMLIRLATAADGPFLVALNVLTVIAMIIALLPLVAVVVAKTAPYTDGANCNAAGVAVMTEVATRIGRGRVDESMFDEQGEIVLHGEEAALESGYVPEGASFTYDAPVIREPEFAEESPEARLMAAKAAVAALSGKPVSNTINIDISDHLVQVKEPPVMGYDEEDLAARREETMSAFAPVAPAETMVEVAEGAASAADAVAAGVAVAGASAYSAASDNAPSEVPAWFKAAQEKARKSTAPAAPSQRSRYADALDAAVRESSNHFQQANAAIASEAEQRLQQMRDSIMEVKAPGFEDSAFEPIQMPASVPTDAADQTSYKAGVDGFLANATSAEDYEHAKKQPTALDAASERSALASVPSVIEVPSSAPAVTDSNAPAASAAAPAQVASDDATLSDVADRTISFIPVAVDGDELRQEAAAHVGKPAVPTGQRVTIDPAGVAASAAARKKRDIALPSLTGEFAPIDNAPAQRAPLAFGAEAAEDRGEQLRAQVPAVNLGAEAADRKAALRSSLPSLSGVIREQTMQEEMFAEEPADDLGNVSQAGSFASAGATGAFAPVGDELVDDYAEDEMYVDDADDSVYEDQYTETGAFAGPGYVEMPKSRASRIFGKFGFGKKKKQQEETTPQQWLDVDDEFDARSVGKARGGWESFRDDQADYDDYYDDGIDDQYSDGSGRRWNGGGFSRSSLGSLVDRVKKPRGKAARQGDEHAEGDAYYEEGHYEEPFNRVLEDGFDQDYAQGDVRGAAEFDYAHHEHPAAEPYERHEPMILDEVHAENVQRIHGFRHPEINTEVWFVALGSDLANNGGMRAFMADHAADLKGAIIIELDGLGAGNLTLIEEEGTYRSVKTSSRMKRYTRKASSTLGMSVGSGSMTWKNSASACAMRNGCQAMHLAGMDRGKPAYYGEADDVAENVDTETMLLNADFVMEVLKNI